MLILADDLAGAADGAAAFGTRDAVVLLGDGAAGDAQVVAIDANTRCLGAEEASREMRRLVQRYAVEGRSLFRKVDSTLRGHVAAELVAVLQARSEMLRDRPVAVFAVALPAQGRTVRDGKLRVHGVPLEQTDAWKREPRAARSDVMEDSGGTRIADDGAGSGSGAVGTGGGEESHGVGGATRGGCDLRRGDGGGSGGDRVGVDGAGTTCRVGGVGGTGAASACCREMERGDGVGGSGVRAAGQPYIWWGA